MGGGGGQRPETFYKSEKHKMPDPRSVPTQSFVQNKIIFYLAVFFFFLFIIWQSTPKTVMLKKKVFDLRKLFGAEPRTNVLVDFTLNRRRVPTTPHRFRVIINISY